MCLKRTEISKTIGERIAKLLAINGIDKEAAVGEINNRLASYVEEVDNYTAHRIINDGYTPRGFYIARENHGYIAVYANRRKGKSIWCATKDECLKWLDKQRRKFLKGKPEPTVKDVYSNRGAENFVIISEIARYYNTTVDYLLGLTDKPY